MSNWFLFVFYFMFCLVYFCTQYFDYIVTLYMQKSFKYSLIVYRLNKETKLVEPCSYFACQHLGLNGLCHTSTHEDLWIHITSNAMTCQPRPIIIESNQLFLFILASNFLRYPAIKYSKFGFCDFVR